MIRCGSRSSAGHAFAHHEQWHGHDSQWLLRMWLPLSSPTIAEDYIASEPMDDDPRLLAEFLSCARKYGEHFSVVTSIGQLGLTTQPTWNSNTRGHLSLGARSVGGDVKVSFAIPGRRTAVSRQGRPEDVVGLLELVLLRHRLAGGAG